MKIPQWTGILALAAATAAGANYPLGTFVYTGSVMNYRHEVCSSADRLTVQAVTTNGTILASSRVVDPVVSTGVNYLLEVPVSSEPSGKSATLGEELFCVVLSAGGSTNVSPRPLPPVDRANAVAQINLVGASSTAFDDGEGGTVLVSDDYLAGLAPWMRANGKDAYDPAADWDGDGASNYAEYKAGTNPFDASDRLRITDFGPSGDSMLLTFEYAGGHLYAVDSTPTLTNRTWKTEPFRDAPDAESTQKTVSFPGDESEDVGTATLYLAPAADSPSMFYTIRVE